MNRNILTRLRKIRNCCKKRSSFLTLEISSDRLLIRSLPLIPRLKRRYKKFFRLMKLLEKP